ncbi:LOW QUALITY PROTEIN: hypothetical protein Cgig2_013695 [Carnegiea gigantea]|uniref:Uncharacterized protein n=1 Tax=Carnegiea gigantea TaxID=171969 RepID=A0A9Q1KE45_9CARY|nr:LOW QUALITY PROTEIN: hypothetical protein Cgig2_013695 [Carnegiea gigantea]
MAGFFSRGTRGAPAVKITYSDYFKPGITRKGANKALPLLFPMTLGVGCHLFRSGVPGLKDCEPRPRLFCIKQKGIQNQAEKLTSIETTNTLKKIVKDQKACRGKEEVVPKELQLREPIQGFPITRLALPLLKALYIFYRLSHKLRDGSELIILPYIELEITGRFSSLGRGLLKGIPNTLTLILTVLEIIPSQVPSPLEGPLDGMHEAKRSCQAVEGCAINSYTFGTRLIHGGIRLRNCVGVPRRQECRNDLRIEKVTARTVLQVRTGWGPWELWSLRNNFQS